MHSTLASVLSLCREPKGNRVGNGKLHCSRADPPYTGLHCRTITPAQGTRVFLKKLICLLLFSFSILAFRMVANTRPEKSAIETPTLAITVQNSSGVPVFDAAVVDDRGLQYRTNANGRVEVLCWPDDCIGRVYEVQASGYKPAKVSVTSEMAWNALVLLESTGSIPRTGSNTTSVIELSKDGRLRLAGLQRQISATIAFKDYDAAESLLMNALQLSPSSAWIMNNLGIIALQRERVEDAGNWFCKGAELAPFNATILGNCGLLHWMQNRTDESYELLTKAASLGFKSGLAHFALGILDLKKGLLNEARAQLERISPERYPYRDLYLGLMWQASGNKKAAEKSFAKFRLRNPVALVTCDLPIGIR